MDDPPISKALDDESFERVFGESIQDVLNLNSWRSGEDLAAIFEEVARQVEEAVRREDRVRQPIREDLFRKLRDRHRAPPGAGVYQATEANLRRVQHGLLFPGAVEACFGTRYSHETLPLTVTQLGVSLVNYNGQQGTWVTRLFRRELQEAIEDPVDEALALLDRRHADDRAERDQMSELARRAILSYVERAALMYRSTSAWRMASGPPAPYELLTGSAGSLDVMIEATRLLEALICEHRKFIFVSPEGLGRALSTIGHALDPLEYAIVESLDERLWDTIEQGQYYLPTRSSLTIDGQRLSPREWMLRFRDEIAAQVVVGLFRTNELAPPVMFFSHADHAHEAAAIAMADGILQVQRGVPMLLELARNACASAFGPDSLLGPIHLAYTRAGAPLRYLSERAARGR